MPPYISLDIDNTIDTWAGAFASPIFVVDNSRWDEISRIIINYEFGAMKATFLSPWWLIWRFYRLIWSACNLFWLRKLDITKITVEKYFPVLDLYFCNEEQIVVLKNRSDNSDWLAQMKCTRKHRILRILVQLLAEIGTGCFANSRGAIHTSSANAITEIVILTSTFLNFSF